MDRVTEFITVTTNETRSLFNYYRHSMSAQYAVILGPKFSQQSCPLVQSSSPVYTGSTLPHATTYLVSFPDLYPVSVSLPGY